MKWSSRMLWQLGKVISGSLCVNVPRICTSGHSNITLKSFQFIVRQLTDAAAALIVVAAGFEFHCTTEPDALGNNETLGQTRCWQPLKLKPCEHIDLSQSMRWLGHSLLLDLVTVFSPAVVSSPHHGLFLIWSKECSHEYNDAWDMQRLPEIQVRDKFTVARGSRDIRARLPNTSQAEKNWRVIASIAIMRPRLPYSWEYGWSARWCMLWDLERIRT